MAGSDSTVRAIGLVGADGAVEEYGSTGNGSGGSGGGGKGFVHITPTIHGVTDYLSTSPYGCTYQLLNSLDDRDKVYADYLWLAVAYDSTAKKQNLQFAIMDMNNDSVDIHNYYSSYTESSWNVYTTWWEFGRGDIFHYYNHLQSTLFIFPENALSFHASTVVEIYVFDPNSSSPIVKQIDLSSILSGYSYNGIRSNNYAPYIEDTDTLYLPIDIGTTSSREKSAIIKIKDVLTNSPTVTLLWLSASGVESWLGKQIHKKGNKLICIRGDNTMGLGLLEIDLTTDTVVEKPLVYPTSYTYSNLLQPYGRVWKYGWANNKMKNTHAIYKGHWYEYSGSDVTGTTQFMELLQNEDGILFDWNSGAKWKRGMIVDSLTQKAFQDASNNGILGAASIDKAMILGTYEQSKVLTMRHNAGIYENYVLYNPTGELYV